MHVVARAYGERSPGVIVSVSMDGVALRAITDRNGQALFIGLPEGAYRLTAELDGMCPFARSGQINERNNRVSVNLRWCGSS